VTARRLENTARVLVFVDGQNVLKGCVQRYGHGYVHPKLLAQSVLLGRTLQGVRYYSGLHEPRVNPALNARVQRRHALMRRCGVTVVERILRYRWEWGFDQKILPDARGQRGTSRQVTVSPYQRAREKGIDLALGLDVVELALRGIMDVAVIVSSDTDLTEVAQMVHMMTGNLKGPTSGNRVSVEAAVFNDANHIIKLTHYDYTHQLRRNDFQAAKDAFDYRTDLDESAVKAFLATLP
jgi:uncharacterized LabA/DUF88 family protein